MAVIEIESELFMGLFIKRLNRFEAFVEINGKPNLTHVPNTGRLRELLEEGAR